MAPTYSNGQEMVSIYLIKIKITTKFFKFAQSQLFILILQSVVSIEDKASKFLTSSLIHIYFFAELIVI